MSNLLTIQEKSLVDIADSIRDNSKKDPETILVRSSNVYTMSAYQKVSEPVNESHVVEVPGAESLEVELQYYLVSNDSGKVEVYEGTEVDSTKLVKSYRYSTYGEANKTVSFTIPGNQAVFRFETSTATNYTYSHGFYATITPIGKDIKKYKVAEMPDAIDNTKKNNGTWRKAIIKGLLIEGSNPPGRVIFDFRDYIKDNKMWLMRLGRNSATSTTTTPTYTAMSLSPMYQAFEDLDVLEITERNMDDVIDGVGYASTWNNGTSTGAMNVYEGVTFSGSTAYAMRVSMLEPGVIETKWTGVSGTGTARSRTAREEAVLYYYE